ncbi:SAM domain and HD [Phlyctochytrium planicorne]|nr:SAM domain and HD [Phlyctochytrium planicorne]
MIFDRSLLDPIHGLIRFDDECWSIIDTPQFQRLRDIKQLGSAYYVYPGASHNRFEHSLGTGYLARKFILGLQERQPELKITKNEVRCITIAGLCHDLGHGPFSHVFDGIFIPTARPGSDWTHEVASNELLEFLIKDNNLPMERGDLEFIQDLIAGEPRGGYTDETRKRRFLYEIVANKRTNIDVDKLDYIARDTHYLGVKNSYDGSRILEYTMVAFDKDSGEFHICFHQKEAVQIYQLFSTRATLFKNSYTHRVGKGVELMIVDALLAADKYLKISNAIDDMSQYQYLTDSILKEIERSTVPELEESRQILRRLRKRDLYQMADSLVIPKEFHHLIVKENVNAEEVLKHIYPLADKYLLTEKDIHVDLLTINYCAKDKNPVDAIKFFRKYDEELKDTFAIPADQTSLMLPASFQEKTVRVFVKDKSKRRMLYSVFYQFLEDFCYRHEIPFEDLTKSRCAPGHSSTNPQSTCSTVEPGFTPTSRYEYRQSLSSVSDDDESENEDEEPLKVKSAANAAPLTSISTPKRSTSKSRNGDDVGLDQDTTPVATASSRRVPANLVPSTSAMSSSSPNQNATPASIKKVSSWMVDQRAEDSKSNRRAVTTLSAAASMDPSPVRSRSAVADPISGISTPVKSRGRSGSQAEEDEDDPLTGSAHKRKRVG